MGHAIITAKRQEDSQSTRKRLSHVVLDSSPLIPCDPASVAFYRGTIISENTSKVPVNESMKACDPVTAFTSHAWQQESMIDMPKQIKSASCAGPSSSEEENIPRMYERCREVLCEMTPRGLSQGTHPSESLSPEASEVHKTPWL